MIKSVLPAAFPVVSGAPLRVLAAPQQHVPHAHPHARKHTSTKRKIGGACLKEGTEGEYVHGCTLV